jgi:hypothetical protein
MNRSTRTAATTGDLDGDGPTTHPVVRVHRVALEGAREATNGLISCGW